MTTYANNLLKDWIEKLLDKEGVRLFKCVFGMVLGGYVKKKVTQT